MPEPLQPHEYPHRILLCVTGLSPQIVTETLYALAVARATPFIPTEIHLLTTTDGARLARAALLHPDGGHFHALLNDQPQIGLPVLMKIASISSAITRKNSPTFAHRPKMPQRLTQSRHLLPNLLRMLTRRCMFRLPAGARPWVLSGVCLFTVCPAAG